MIVSHEHRYIFLKTRKTAGTSVEIALSRQCGPDDIITRIGTADEVTRAEYGGRAEQNTNLPLRMHSPKDLARLAIRGRRSTAYNHMSGGQVRRLVGERVWGSYTKFTIVRNPWDAVVSWYFWRHAASGKSIGEVIRSGELGPLLANADIYSDRSGLLVDRVVRYERLADELESTRAEIGLPEPLELPRAKGGTRTDRRNYRELLTPEDAELVATLFRREIALMGYEF